MDDDTAAAPAARSPYGATGGEIVRVTPVEIEVIDLPEGWNGIRIAALSDFHLGMWPDNANVARAAVERALAERPDLVVLLGDYVGRGGDFAALDRVLAPLKGRPVFAVLGNEDMAENTEGEPDSMAILTRQALERNGVRVLMNQRVPFGRNGDTAYIAGIDPYTARRPDWRRAETFGGIPGGGRTPVMLSHMPVSAATLPTGKYPSMLSGHTFCGGLEVPGTPRLSWVNTELFPQETGVGTNRIYRVRGSTLFITCGVGFSFVPVRFGAPPEVALVTLRPVGGAAKRDSASAPAPVNVDSLIQQFTPDTTKRDTSKAEEEA
ncbi:MAG TPA: metallophosphoesterase [Longimicrobium sp.]|uniref:metallophosphoesterase n=1 Tax=Longimicrobium sp. TaxID=2029185 RepID=UPI002ED7FF93